MMPILAQVLKPKLSLALTSQRTSFKLSCNLIISLCNLVRFPIRRHHHHQLTLLAVFLFCHGNLNIAQLAPVLEMVPKCVNFVNKAFEFGFKCVTGIVLEKKVGGISTAHCKNKVELRCIVV